MMERERMALCVLSLFFSVWIVGCLGNAVDTNFQLELIERINALERQCQHQTEKMQAMESKLVEQDQKLVIQERIITDNKRRLDEQDSRLAVQDSAISDYKHKVVALEQTVAELKLKQNPDVAEDQPMSDVDASSGQNSGIVRQERSEQTGDRSAVAMPMWERRALLGAEGPVAFHAVITAGGDKTHLGVNQKIVFPDVMTNLGGGYHNQHGLFIAPQPGVYIFSASIMSSILNHVEIYVHLMKNGQRLANAFAHSDSGRYDQGSVTVVTQLAAADEVWVSLYGPADTSLYGDAFDSFMGCLVVPL